VRPSPVRRFLLFLIVLGVVAAWPPDKGRSLLVRTINAGVDPAGRLPILPEQLGFGISDDPMAVEERDAEVRRYDELYNAGGLSRARLELKVAKDPFDPTTERQLLLAGALVAAFLVLRRA
jgi:hypothetical protein